MFREEIRKDLTSLGDQFCLAVQVPLFGDDKIVKRSLFTFQNRDGYELLNPLKSIYRRLLNEFGDILAA